MKLEFADDRIQSYENGPLRYINDGSGIEVSAATASEMLNAKHLLDGEWVDVFRPADAKTKKAEAKGALATYPEGFPHADVLAKAGINHSEVVLFTREQLEEVSGIGPKSAEAILEFSKEK